MGKRILASGQDPDGFDWAVWRVGNSGRLIAEVRPPHGLRTFLTARPDYGIGHFVCYVLDEIESRRVLA
jgi:hypothetical protein